MVKSDKIELESEMHDDNEELTEVIDDATSEDSEETEEEESKPRLPKWAKILLMILPAAIFVTTIVLVDHFVGFPPSVSANAVIALTGIGLLGFVVIADMLYRNLFVSRMLRRETKKSKIYKEILKDKKEAQKEKTRFDTLDEDYSYDDEDFEEEGEFVEELESQEEFDEEEEDSEDDEYQYDYEDEDESKYYRTRSLAIRGGIFSILIVNSLIIIAAAVILQMALYGGFVVTDGT